jgi:DNA primase
VAAVVEAVPISPYVQNFSVTELKQAGLRLVGLCPLYEEKTPSFTVYGDSFFYCFGCSEWGDVVSLHARLDGHSEQWTAMMDLAERYGVEVPGRSERWQEAQERRVGYQRAKYAALGEVLKKRLFKAAVAPRLEGIRDPAEYDRALEDAWASMIKRSSGRLWLRRSSREPPALTLGAGGV